MPVTNYYSANGEIIGEHTTGQSRLDYVTDALGSVISTVDQTLTVKSTARYKPYGADLATTGTQVAFGWVGAPGYRRTGRPHSDIYIRKRHDSTIAGRWTSVDPIWPIEPAYGYVAGNVVNVTDPSGLQSYQQSLGQYNQGWLDYLPRLCSGIGDSINRKCDQFYNFLGRTCTETVNAVYDFGGYIDVVAGIPMNGCKDCAIALASSWFPTLQHWDNHGYAHCMACCALTRYYGSKCAVDNQNHQNTTWPLGKGPIVAQDRMHFCMIGVGVGSSKKGSCDAGCRSNIEIKYNGPPLPPPPFWTPCVVTTKGSPPF